jgi:hypothetical protein
LSIRHTLATAVSAVALAFCACAQAALADPTPTPAPPTPAMMVPKPAATTLPSATPAPSPSPSPIPHLIQLSGEGDLGTNFLWSAQKLQFTNTSNARVFDYLNNELNFQNLQVAGTLTAGNLGGKAQLSFGNDANIIASFGQPNNAEFNITQAWLSYALGPVTIQAGKYGALAGEETITSATDWNYSRSILFGYAIGFTTTGVRATYAAPAHITAIVGGNEGWDVVNSANHAISFEGELAWNPSSAFSIVADGTTGQQQISYASLGPEGNRTMYDIIVTGQPIAPLTLVLNYDYGSQKNAFPVDSTGTPLTTSCSIGGEPSICDVQGSANWNGFAAYANYAFSPTWSGTLRGEEFSDGQGYRTGYAQTWTEGTGTIQYAPGPFIFRAEYRLDNLNHPNFLTASSFGGSTGTSHLSTIGLEAIVKF